MNLVLIGFTSCGKSAVGEELAHRTSRTFVDLDDEIMKRDPQHRARPRDIYIEEGEAVFRQCEADALRACAELSNSVLSTGGGAPLHTPNHALLKAIGPVVWITAPPETLLERMLISKGVPSFLASDPTVENIARVLEERRPFYEAVASTTVDTDGLTVEEVADKLLHFLDLHNQNP